MSKPYRMPAQGLERHELSSAWPDMPEDDLLELMEDIKANGQRDPIIMYQGAVLDGWHRARACQMAGVEGWFRDYDGGDPLAFVISKNKLRRHITKEEIAKAVLRAADWMDDLPWPDVPEEISAENLPELPDQESPNKLKEAPEKRSNPEGGVNLTPLNKSPKRPADKPTHKDLAEKAGVSEATMHRAKRELKAETEGEPAPKKQVVSQNQKLKQRVAALEEENDTLREVVSDREMAINLEDLRELDDESAAAEAERLLKRNRVLEGQIKALQMELDQARQTIRMLEKRDGA